MTHWIKALISAAFVSALVACATPAPRQEQWLATWASAQQIPEPHNALPAAQLTDSTLRQTVRVSVGGETLRVRFSNVHGTTPLTIEAAHLARAEASGVANTHGEGVPLTFNGQPRVIIPAGADYLSDVVSFPVAPFNDLAISLYLREAPAQQTSHPGSRTTSYTLAGNHVAAAFLPGAASVDHWYFISGVEVMAPADAQAIAIIGDSITDGRGSTTNGNDRWTDYLVRRLQANPATQDVSVLNFGLGGNRILNDGNGPSALSRFKRDTVAQTGVRHVIVFEGINDLGTLMRDTDGSAAHLAGLTERVIGAYRQMIADARAHDLKIYGATIAPYAGGTIYRWTPESEAARNAINDWIRTSGEFDAVFDFDAVLRDPANPTQLLPAYDMGDKLHPSTAGFEAMAAVVPLALFER